MSKRIRDGIYQGGDGFQYFSFKFKGKKYQGPTGYESRKKALEFKRDLISKLAHQKADLSPPEAPSLLVKDLWKDWQKDAGRTCSDAHLKRVSRDWDLHILPALGELKAMDLDTAKARAFRVEYLKSPSLRNQRIRKTKAQEDQPETLPSRTATGANRLMANLHLVFGWALEVEKIGHIPFSVKPLREQEPVRHFLRLEQVEPFLAAVDRLSQAGAARKAGKEPKGPTDALHLRVAIRAMLYLLLREEDALGMKWKWFGADYKTYTPGDTKGGEAVTLPVLESMRPSLAILKKRATEGCEWVLPAADLAPHRGQYTRKLIEAAGKAIGIPHLTPHRMRGTGATLMARADVSAFVIQKAGRWKSLDVVQRYIKILEEDVAEAQAKAFNLSPTTVPQKIDPPLKA